MNWDLYDYAAAAGLLIAIGIFLRVSFKLWSKHRSGALLMIGLAGLVVLVWVQLAVGLV